jgi:hypothetical protein
MIWPGSKKRKKNSQLPLGDEPQFLSTSVCESLRKISRHFFEKKNFAKFSILLNMYYLKHEDDPIIMYNIQV